MKNSIKKKVLIGASLVLGAALLSGCTANFCSEADKASIAYPYEQGVTIYYDSADTSVEVGSYVTGPALEGNDHIYKVVPTKDQSNSAGTVTYAEFTAKKANFVNSTIGTAVSNGYRLPSIQYWSAIDDFVLQASVVNAYYDSIDSEETYKFHYDSNASAWVDSYQSLKSEAAFVSFVSELTAGDVSSGKLCVNPYAEADTDGKEATVIANKGTEEGKGYSLLREYGRIKFSGENGEMWGFYNNWTKYLRASDAAGFGLDGCPSADFMTVYKKSIENQVANVRSCIATQDGYFGHYGNASDWEVSIEKKDWGYAWTNGGFLEGLLVYPVSWLVDNIAYGIDPALTGFGQIISIILVTLIVRGVLLAATFRNTMGQQKMQALQPELAKIQAKYPNSDTNQAEKQRMATEQMALYKRNGIHPFRSILVMFVQFPLFICVWSALQGSAALASGSFLNLNLSDTIQSVFMNFSGTWYQNTTGWWTALVLFILMAGVQVFAMLLPQIFTKIRTKKLAKLSKNPAQDKQGGQMKMMMWFMLIFTIFMGFMLPSAMGVYWLIGGIMSVIQTLITQLILGKKTQKKK